jgi:hypothetical protein
MKDRKAYEAALKRRKGSPGHSEKVKENMLSQDDLFTQCRHCGGIVRGTLESLTQHVETCQDG